MPLHLRGERRPKPRGLEAWGVVLDAMRRHACDRRLAPATMTVRRGAEVALPGLWPPRCEAQPLCFPDGPVEVTFRSRHGDGPAAQTQQSA